MRQHSTGATEPCVHMAHAPIFNTEIAHLTAQF
jgi:hypothetical protein